MNINKLLETQHNTNIKSRNINKPLRAFKQSMQFTDKFGMYSKVKNDTDPHLVHKSSRQARPSDYTEGFKAFIMYLHEHGHMDNIHFPRVYDIKTIKGIDGYSIDTFRVEKLVEGSQIDVEVMHAYAVSILNPKRVEEEFNDGSEIIYYDRLADYIAAQIKYRHADHIRNKQLLKACDIVREMAHSRPDAHIDVHDLNIMFRRTPYGIQVVLNDPIHISIDRYMNKNNIKIDD